MKRSPFSPADAFTLAELMISISASVIIIGALLVSSAALQKAMHGSEHYAQSYSDQRRLIDFIARDLRRSIALAATDAGGAPTPLAGVPFQIEDRAELVVTLPAYYQSQVSTETNYDQPLTVVATGDRLDYGTGATPAPPVQVAFRKIYVAEEKCVCFVRQEADSREVIVRDAEELNVRVTIAPDAQAGRAEVWFLSKYSVTRPLITTHDDILLRNPRLE